METFKGIFSSVDFWKFAIPLLGAVVAWFLNEWRKRIWEQYVRKEDQYKQLIRCLRGFYIDAKNPQLKAEFIEQLNICWLYCPDNVIQKAYAFLDTVHTDQKQTDQVKESAMGELVLAIREDLLSRKLVSETLLSASEFRHLTTN